MKKIPRPKKQTQVLLGFLFLFISCDGAYQRYIISGKTMGTTYSVKLVFTHSDHEKSKIEKVIDSILISLNQQMSTWIDDSEISIFNKSLSTAPYKVSDEFFHVLERGKKINNKTGGAFDYTIFPVAELWGFGPDGNQRKENPEKSEIENVLGYVGIDKVQLKYPYVNKLHPKVQLDLNAIAKGYAVDIIYDWVSIMGYSNIFVEIGGEIRCSGINMHRELWVVGIDMPRKKSLPGQELYTTLPLNNEAIATSGNYRSFIVQDGNTINHSFNPVSGFPVETDIASVSVKSGDCLTADAWATALMVLPYQVGIKKVEEDNTIEALWVILNKDNNFEHYSSSGFFE